MTTRAGAAGLITGLILTIVIYLLFIVEPGAFLGWEGAEKSALPWIAGGLAVLLFFFGGWMAVRSSGSGLGWRCAVLGGLSGTLAGMVAFCLWGAGIAGQTGWFLPDVVFTGVTVSKTELIVAVVDQTLTAFLGLFLGGGLLGALGGLTASTRRQGKMETFDLEDPQMAMNASITALPASVLAAALAAFMFSRLSRLIGGTDLELPLAVALLQAVISHLALTLVVPHEARQAWHRCGTDEVKMTAFVGIGAAPVLVLLLALADAAAFKSPFVSTAILASVVMSGVNVYSLLRVVLPKRALLPAPQDELQKTEAVLFGTIAFSRAGRLIVLCTGCGLAMVLPFYTCVLSVLVNLSGVSEGVLEAAAGVRWGLFAKQFLVSVGTSAAAVGLLVLIYMLYLNLGRWWRKRGK